MKRRTYFHLDGIPYDPKEGDSWEDRSTHKVWHMKDHWHYVGINEDNSFISVGSLVLKNYENECSSECISWNG